jgi:hypothetical protein
VTRRLTDTRIQSVLSLYIAFVIYAYNVCLFGLTFWFQIVTFRHDFTELIFVSVFCVRLEILTAMTGDLRTSGMGRRVVPTNTHHLELLCSSLEEENLQNPSVESNLRSVVIVTTVKMSTAIYDVSGYNTNSMEQSPS